MMPYSYGGWLITHVSFDIVRKQLIWPSFALTTLHIHVGHNASIISSQFWSDLRKHLTKQRIDSELDVYVEELHKLIYPQSCTFPSCSGINAISVLARTMFICMVIKLFCNNQRVFRYTELEWPPVQPYELTEVTDTITRRILLTYVCSSRIYEHWLERMDAGENVALEPEFLATLTMCNHSTLSTMIYTLAISW